MSASRPSWPPRPWGWSQGGECAGPQQDLAKNVSHWAGPPGPAVGVMCRAQAHKGHQSPVSGWLSLWGPRPTTVQGGHGEAGLKKPDWRPVWITLHRICEHPYPCGLGSVHASHACESLVCGLPSVSSVTSHTIPRSDLDHDLSSSEQTAFLPGVAEHFLSRQALGMCPMSLLRNGLP